MTEPSPSIAGLIADNPTVTLSDLRRQHHITQHERWRAQEMFRVHRKNGERIGSVPKRQ